MKYAATIIAALMLTVTTATADPRSVTYFFDGATVAQEFTSAGGIVAIPLPPGMVEETLRIIPMGGAFIRQTQILSTTRNNRPGKEFELLLERKSRLEDRLRALEVREEIFKAAAKSQSGKAPRKTKANPDPMQSIRQGTEFAIAQLETVYTARRKTEQDLRRLDTQLAAARRVGAGAVARVAITPKNGRVKAVYAITGQGWSPRYDLRMNGDGYALLTMYGQLPDGFTGYSVHAAPGTLAEGPSLPALSVRHGGDGPLADYRLPVADERFGADLRLAFSVVVTNPGPLHLPAGEATLYRNGEYRGRFRFEGISSERSRRISVGG